MNQQIQIIDGFEFDEVKGVMVIKAISSGQMIDCWISGIDKLHADSFYLANQFDLEECLTEKIELEEWDDKGIVHLSMSNL